MVLFQGPAVHFLVLIFFFFFPIRGSPKLYKLQALQNLDSPLSKKNSVDLTQRKSRAFIRRISCTAQEDGLWSPIAWVGHLISVTSELRDLGYVT